MTSDYITPSSRRSPLHYVMAGLGIALRVVPIAVALAVAAVVIVYPKLAGLENTVIVTGSMRPAYEPGDLALIDRAIPPENIGPGDIIIFFDPARTLVSHRVIGIEHDGEGGLLFRTKGDANEQPDDQLIPAADYRGRLEHRLPKMGRVLAFIKQREIVYAALFIPAGLIIANELMNIVAANRKPRGSVS
ncbi:MAG: signal peptidase I [Dehalococcoidia bacterium]